MNKHDSQMELDLASQTSTVNRPPAAGPRREPRAKWWFQQMHRMVDGALDWKTAPKARPQQLSMSLSRSR